MIEKEKRFTSDLFAYQGNSQVRNIILAYKNSCFFSEKRIESLCFRYYTHHHDNNRNIFIYWKKSSLEEKHWTYFIVIRKSGR